MTAAIDTNILVDILLDDTAFYTTSKELLEEFNERGALIISPAVYAELLTQFIRRYSIISDQKLETFLKDLSIKVVEFAQKDLKIAAEAWNKFSERSKEEITCQKCGHKHIFHCERCKHKLCWRNHIITDFLIGAHAQNNAEFLLTRDRGFYAAYFKIKIIEKL